MKTVSYSNCYIYNTNHELAARVKNAKVTIVSKSLEAILKCGIHIPHGKKELYNGNRLVTSQSNLFYDAFIKEYIPHLIRLGFSIKPSKK